MKKRVFAFTLTIAMVLLLFAACSNGDSGKTEGNVSDKTVSSGDKFSAASGSEEEKLLTSGVTTAWTTLVATSGTGDVDIFIRSMLYDSLVNFDMDGNIYPRLASSWEVDDSGTVWTIHIDEDAFWSDGTPVTAGDVAYTYRLYATKGFCNFSTWLAYIEGTEQSGLESSEGSLKVVAQDDKTLVITSKFSLEESLFWSTLSSIYVIPEHIYGEMDPFEINDSQLWYNDPVTSGPMKFSEQVAGQSIEFESNDDYFLGAPNIDRFIVKVITSATIASSLMSGDIDVTPGTGFSAISATDYDLLNEESSITIEPVYSYNYVYMCINQQLEYFSDVRVRRALSMAINRPEIVDSLLRGYGNAVYTPYGSNHPYYNNDLKVDGYNPKIAKELLEEAGWDFDRVITITVPSSNEIRQRACLMIQQYWQAVGVQVEVETVDFATLFRGLSSGERECGTMGQMGNSTATEPIDAYTPGHIIDMSHLQSDDFYKMYLAMKSTGDIDEITSLVYELQQKIADEVPYIYLFSQAYLQAHNNRVLNYDFSDCDCRYWPVWEWDVK